MNNEITTIITLYKTPLNKLKNLDQYKNLNPIFFEQNGSLEKKQELKNILNFQFKYFFSKKKYRFKQIIKLSFNESRNKVLFIYSGRYKNR